ncbi:Dihydrofolate reductase [compost metagenome]
MVIGGGGVFQHFLEFADVLLITLIDEDFEGDVFFPDFDKSKFTLVSETKGIRDEKNPHDYTFLRYERLQKNTQ